MSKKKDAIDALYERGRQLFEKLNKPHYFEESLKDSVIIANLGKGNEKDNLKSYDTLNKADLLDYSLKANGNLDNSKLKDSISNTYLESSENGSSKREGFLNSEGKFVKVDISQYKSLVLKYGKINFNNVYMNNSFVNNNDILYLESKIPIFKAKNSGEILYDTLKNYHQQGSDREDRNNVVNINQSNTHKINLDESNFAAIAGSKIFIFLHKIIQGNFRKKQNGSKKDISSAQSTEVIQNSDIIIGYSTLEMNKIFLSEDFKYSGKINVVEKKKIIKAKKNEKNEKSNMNKKGASKEKDTKNKKEALYDEKGERLIGSLEITCFLKRPYQKIFKDDNKLILSTSNNNNNQNINNNQLNMNNMNNMNNINNFSNINNNKKNIPSSLNEFIIGQPAAYNQNNNQNDNSRLGDYYDDKEDKKMDEGMQKIQTDINGDILILYLKINELKASNDIQASQASLTNLNNINEQLNNNMNNNKNIIFYNL